MVVAFARTAVKEQCPLRGASLVLRSASLTASSLRLPLFYVLWGSERSPLLLVGFRFHQFSQVLEVLPPQKNRSASPVSRSFLAITQERPLEVTFERFLISLRKERPR
jgi:hypothetical protein